MAAATRLIATVVIDSLEAANGNGVTASANFQVTGWDADGNAATDPGLTDEIEVAVPYRASLTRCRQGVRRACHDLLIATGLPYVLYDLT